MRQIYVGGPKNSRNC